MRLPSYLIPLVVTLSLVAVPRAGAQPPLDINNGADLGSASVGPLQIELGATGGVPPYTWAVTGETLPSGTALRTDVPPWFAAGSIALSGVTTAPGNHSFQLTVTDSAMPANTASRWFSLTVTGLTVTDVSAPDGFVDVAYDHTFTLAGGSAALSLEPCGPNPVPPGLSLVGNQLTGLPTMPGTYGFQIRATSGATAIWRCFGINIYGIRITTPGTLPNAQQGSAYETFLDADGGSGTYTWNTPNPPPGFTLESSTGRLYASAGSLPQPGEYFFQVTANDGTHSHHRNFLVAVLPVTPSLPSLNSPVPLEDFTIGEGRSLHFGANGGVPPYTFAVSGLPAALALKMRAPDSHEFDWPNQGILEGTALASGTYALFVSVTDSAPTPITVTRPVTLNVSALAIDHPNFNLTLNAPFSGTVRAFGGSGSTYSATLDNANSGALPTGVSFTGATVTFAGTPLEWGGYNPRLTIDDGNGHTLTRSFHIPVNGNGSIVNINSGNPLPDATRNQFYTFQLWSCCAPNTAWSEEPSHPLPAGLSVNGGGLISGTVTLSGNYTFRVRATNVNSPADFVIREFHLNVTPVFVTTNPNLPFANEASNYNVELNADGGATGFTWEVEDDSELPPGLQLVFLNGEWKLSGTATTAGRFHFNLRVSDQSGNSRRQFFNLDIYPFGTFPPLAFAMGDDFGTWQLGMTDIGLHASGGDGNYTWEVVAGDEDDLPPGIRLRTDPAPWFPPNTQGTLSGVATTPGPYEFDLRVTSGDGQTIAQTFRVKITALQVLDPHQLPDAFVNAASEYEYPFTTTSQGSPWWEVQPGTTLPPGLMLDQANGRLHGFPTAPGTYNVHFRITEGTEVSFTGHQLVVSAIHIAGPSLVLATQSQAITPVQFTATPGPAATYQWSASRLPQGITLSADGLLSGTPAFATTFSLMVTATDTTTGRFYSKGVTIQAKGVPLTLLSLNWFDPDDWTVGQRRSLTFSANGGVAPYTWHPITVASPPELLDHVRLRTTGMSPFVLPTQAELFGIIQATGVYTFEVSVTDSSPQPVTVTRTFTIRASELGMSGIGPIPLTFETTHPASPIRVIGGTPGYDFVVESGKLPAGLAVSAAGILSGTPRETGNSHSRLLITDDEGRELRTGFGLFVGAAPLATVQINNHYELSATLNQSFFFGFSACCLPSSEWALEPFLAGESLPPGLALSPQGSLSGMPSAAGLFRFRTRVFDPGQQPDDNFAVREFIVTVAPFVYNAATNLQFMNVGAGALHVLAAPSGGSGPVEWSVPPDSQLPPGLTLTYDPITDQWSIAGTPQSPGQFNFTLILSRGGFSRRIGFNVSVYPPGQHPPLNLGVSGQFGPQRVGRVQINLPVSDGTPPYALSYVPGFEVPGVRVQTIGEPQPIGVPPTNTGTLLGVITTAGTYPTRVRATDNAGGSIERDITIIVSPLAVTTFSSLPDAVLGTAYSHTLTALGGSGNYLWTVPAGTNLHGLSLSPAGVLGGTPTSVGPVSFSVTVDDGSTTLQQFINLTVHPFGITSNSVLPIATQGVPYTVPLQGAGCPCNWSIVRGGLPGGLSLSSSGVITGTPNGFGTSALTLTATAGAQSSRKPFTIHVQSSTPQPIQITPADTLQNATIGQQYLASILPRGGVPPYTWEVLDPVNLPPGLTMTDGLEVTFNTSGDVPHLAGVPTEVGEYDFTLRLTDSSGTNPPADFPLTMVVSPIGTEYFNLPLFGTTLRYNEQYDQRLLAIGGSGSYTWSPAGPLVAGLSLAATDLVSGVPNSTGNFGVTITATDDVEGGAFSSSVNFNISAATPFTLNINQGPALGTFAQGATVAIGLTASGGPFPPAPARLFTFALAAGSSLPPGFALVSGDSLAAPAGPGQAPAQIVGVPLQTGTFTFTLEVRDQDNNFGSKTMTLIVSPHTIFTPGTLPDASTVTAYNQKLHAFGPNATWSQAPVGGTLPPGLNLVGDTLVGTATTPGTYSFTLRVCDAGQTTCVLRTFTLRIGALALTDASILGTATLGAPYSHTFATLGGGASKTFAIIGGSQSPGGLPTAPGGVLPGGLLSGTPSQSGTFTFALQVSDGTSTFAKPFTLYVVDPNPALPSPTPASGSDTRFVTVGQTFSYVPQARLGTPPYSWQITAGTLPAGLTWYTPATLPSNINPGSYLLAGAPTAAGTSTVQLTATDAAGKQTAVSLTIVVSPIGFTQNNLRSANYNVPYAQQLVVAGGTGVYTEYKLAEESVLPTGVDLTPATGLITGTPTDTGNFSFQVEVTDSGGARMRRTYNVFVNATPGTLDLNNGLINDITAGTGMTFTLRAFGPTATTTVNWGLKAGSTLPPGLSLLWGGTLPGGFPAGSAVLVGTPTTPGSYAFTVQATDSAGNFGERLQRLQVSPMQILSLGLRDAAVDTEYIGDPLIVVGAASPQFILPGFINNVPPPGMTWNEATGAFGGTPVVAGNFVLTVRITSGGLRLQRNISINIAPAGQVTPLVPGARVFPDASVGVPLAQPLDVRASGGAKPYTWSAGAGLPAGVTLVPGSGANSAYLVGSPISQGSHSFTLTAQDAVGQMMTATYSMNVSPIRFSPETLPVAAVGTPYPLTLTAAGGTAPYTITAGLASSVPPNLSRSIGGATASYAGTPGVQGRFGAGFTITDSAGATLNRGIVFSIDSAATPSPYLTLNPTSVQVTYTLGGPVPAPYPVEIATSSTPVSFTALLGNIPGASLSLTSGTTPRTTNIVFDGPTLLGLSPGNYYGVLAAASGQAVLPSTAVPVTLTVLPAPPCVFTLGSSSATFASDLPNGGQSDSFSMSVWSTCNWTATSDSPSWLQVNGDSTSGVGSRTINYTVLSDNLSQTPRVGHITVGGQQFTVTQFGLSCAFVLSPVSLAPQAGGATDAVTVSASDGACTWTVSAPEPWVALTPQPALGRFLVTTSSNPNVGPRSATITLFDSLSAPAGTVTVNQAGIGCGVTLSHTIIDLPAGGDDTARSHSVDVTNAPCGYATVPPPQVTITSGASSAGTGTVAFFIAQNVSTQPRSVTMQIGDQSFQITQPGMACEISVTGSNPMINSGGGSGSFGVDANVPTCDWSAASGAPWLIIDSGHTGEGDGAVNFSVVTNTSPQQRSTTLTIGGQSVQITQAGITCTYALRSISGTVPAGGSPGSVGVIAASACAWTSQSNAGWLAISSSDDGGTGYVSFLASANPTALERTGTITLNNNPALAFTVTQPPAPCSYTVSSSSTTIANTGTGGGPPGSFTFSTFTTGCTPAVQSFSGWIHESHSFTGTSGSVTYTVDPNPFGISRVGRIQVGDRTFTLTQEGAACMYSLHAPSATFTAAGGSGELLATGSAGGCSPAVGASPEIHLGLLTLPPPVFIQPYTVDPFVTSAIWVRTMSINFGGVTFAVKQTSW